MKTKNNPLLTVNLKLFLILPLILLALFAFSSCASKKKAQAAKAEIAPAQPTDDIPFVVVEEMPMFPGGDSALLAYIVNNTKYPALAKTNNIQGRVIARFCVNKEGGVDRVSILKGVDPQLDAEAIRVVSTLPVFKPGKQGGKAVSVWYMVPITFTLNALKTDTGSVPPPPPPPPPPPAAVSTDQVLTVVDEMPQFKGGDAALLKYIAENTTYPVEAKKKNITGKVIVKLVVEKDCSVSNIEIAQSVNTLLDNEAIKVVSTLPNFEKPGKMAGKAVRVQYMIPITFALK
jgi:TonB family protein